MVVIVDPFLRGLIGFVCGHRTEALELFNFLAQPHIRTSYPWLQYAVSARRHHAWLKAMAGAVGFEPTCGGSKVRCLTTWRRPNGSGSPTV